MGTARKGTLIVEGHGTPGNDMSCDDMDCNEDDLGVDYKDDYKDCFTNNESYSEELDSSEPSFIDADNAPDDRAHRNRSSTDATYRQSTYSAANLGIEALVELLI